jgi:glycosyltransferase involved in cell wall biosynthesis
MQQESPLVSVVMPVYNARKFLAKAISSIISQSLANFELIIINDGSTDGSPEIINSFASTDKRIHVISNPSPLGKAGDAAKELGIKMSKGKYIAIMDADDTAMPNRLEVQYNFMEAHPDIFLCGSWAEYIDANDEKFLEWKPAIDHDQIVNKLYLKNSIMHPTFFFRNENLPTPFYEAKYEWYNDYYTQLKLIKLGKRLANVPHFLLSYRVSGSATTQSNIKNKALEYFDIRKEIAGYSACKPSLTDRAKVFAQYVAIKYLPEKIVLRFHPIFKKTI